MEDCNENAQVAVAFSSPSLRAGGRSADAFGRAIQKFCSVKSEKSGKAEESYPAPSWSQTIIQ
jgi:hypothetical protein